MTFCGDASIIEIFYVKLHEQLFRDPAFILPEWVVHVRCTSDSGDSVKSQRYLCA